MITVQQKDKWIKALRSGSYKQCYAKTHDPISGRYCALGVLLDVCGYGTKNYIVQIINAGLSIPDQIKITTLNDVDCISFPEIADWISNNVETKGE